MLDDLNGHDVIARLEAAAQDLHLPQAAQDQARELADRLTNGVRIVVLGPGGIGKSELCDAILSLPQATDGHAAHRVFVEGATASIPVPLLEQAQCVSVDDILFGNAHIVDISGQETGVKSAGQARQLLDCADIVLWCTESYDPEEAETWARAPDTLKDHSLLVLTKADALADQGVLHDRIVALQSIAAEEFHSFFPVTTRHLRGLQSSGDSVPENQWAASGIKALIDAVKAIVRSGERADLDGAALFLERQVRSQNKQSTAHVIEPLEVNGGALDAAPVPRPRGYETAREKIMERAGEIYRVVGEGVEDDMSPILELCGSVSEELVDIMHAQSAVHPEVKPWLPVFEEASDKIMLMTLENDARSAADAVTILLQLRREMDCLSVS